ncbi:MAG: DUF1795 domain-containing protein [Thermomicrobiales bacterium]|jgi:hypothetical protein|nr:MAG: DUF1795 domain-containing protein [Thermomicrobiales bacterium]
MSTYQFNEGSITVADGLADRTMHVLAPKPGAMEFTLLISHDELEPDEDMHGFVKRQLADLARQVSKYEEEPWQPVSLGDPRLKVDGLLLTLRYKQQGKFVFHRQAVFPIPDAKHLLTFTASLPVPFSPAQMQQFLDVLRSYVPRG